MWSAFLTGAAKEATSLIKERDKEIRDNMNVRLNEMYKRAEIAKKEAEERRNELTGLANELVGAGFNEQEAAYLLQNPEQAKKIIDYADKTGGISVTKKQQLFSKNKEHLNAIEGETAQEYIKRVTTLGTGGRTSLMAPGETEGAFGLPSRAAEQGMSEFLAKAGRTEEDLLATELPGREVKSLGLDMSAFAEAKTFKEREDAAKLAMLDNPAGSPEYKEARTEYLRIVGINKAAKDLEEGGGSMSLKESDIRSNLRQFHSTILDNLAGKNKDFVKITDNQGNSSYKFKGNKANVLEAINRGKEEAFADYINRAYARPDGSIPEVVKRIADTFLAEATVTLDNNGTVNPATVSPKGAEPAATPEAASAAVTKIPVTAPNGKTYYFNTQAEADAFKAQAGIK